MWRILRRDWTDRDARCDGCGLGGDEARHSGGRAQEREPVGIGACARFAWRINADADDPV
jgi:hypothetical protein